MGRNYMASLPATNTVSTTIGVVTSAATVRPKIFDFDIGSEATPGDQAARYVWQRFTAAGTTTAVTPTALDPADPAALTAAGKVATVEPTYTSNLFLYVVAVNQRAAYRWVAAPGAEMTLPATASNGAGFVATVVTSAFAVSLGVIWNE